MISTAKWLLQSIACSFVLSPTVAIYGQQPAAETLGIRVRTRVEGNGSPGANVPLLLKRLPDLPVTFLDDTIESRAAYLNVMSKGGAVLPAPTPSRTVMTPEEAQRGLAGAAGTTPPNNLGGGVTSPILLQQVQPSYSDEARQKGIHGTVELMIVIREDGSVVGERVTRSLGYGLDERAAEAVRQWRFRPATKSGIPVASYVSVLINFSLRSGPAAPVPTTQRTDAQGDVILSGLAPGRYAVSAQIDEYFGAAELVVGPSGNSESVALSLSPTGVISGRVLDAAGSALRAATVSWGLVVIQEGKLVFLHAGSVPTNESGEYRLTGVGAGNYHLAVRPPAQEFSYAYYPGTRELKDTQAVSVRPGQELVGIDIEVAK